MTIPKAREVSVADKNLLWRAGRLSWKLHASQLDVYSHYRLWEKQSFNDREKGRKIEGIFPRIFVLDCSRRWGKDYLSLLIRIEDAIRKPNLLLSYGCDTAKNASEIALPLAQQICSDAPANVRPVLKTAYMGTSSGLHFPNGSVLRIVGCDRNPEALRGRFSDGVTLSEAAFIDNLEYITTSVIIPQLQGRLEATIFLNSTPAPVPGHAWDEKFCPDAYKRHAYARKTIDDNPLLSDSEREEFIQSAGGPESETCRREYYVERIRSATRTVVPEFEISRHVRISEMPEFALGYTVIDPAVKDICAISCGYVDFERAKLVIRKDWGKRNANTNEVRDALLSLENEVFGPEGKRLRYWRGTRFENNPIFRFSDTDARLIIDLNTIHGIRIGAADKDGAEAALHSLRNGFHRNQIEIHPEASLTIEHVQNAVWNKSRTTYERSDVFGHFDALDVLKYMWRHANRDSNPNPPLGIRMRGEVPSDDLFIKPSDLRTPLKQVEQLVPTRWRTRRIPSARRGRPNR